MPTTSTPEPSRRASGRPPATSHEEVVASARRIVLSEGFDALSVRRVAADLGVSVFAAHRHMGSKEQLLDELVAQAIEERGMKRLRATTWKKALTEYATGMWELLGEHPSLVDALQRTVCVPETAMAGIDRIVTLASHEGVSAEDITHNYEIVWLFVLGAAGVRHARAGTDERARLGERAASLTPDMPGAASLLETLAQTDRDSQFAVLLRRLIDAL